MFQNDIRRALGLTLFCTLGLLVAGRASAQAPGGGKNMLWRVESDSHVVYILGSVHVLPKSMYPLNPIIERAFDSSEKVAFEVNLDSINQSAGASAIFAKGLYPDGRTLKKSISKSTYRLAEKRLKKEGMDIGMFDRFRPWVIAFMLTGLDGGDKGFDPQYGIDLHFHKEATRAGKEVLGLETVDDQLGVFAEMSDQTQEDFLRQALTNNNVENELDIILAAWKKGETKALEELLRRYTSNDTTMYEAMLYRRNRNWMPTIERYLHDPNTKRYLVIVGSLHLVGNRGVIEMLRAKGYRVEQM